MNDKIVEKIVNSKKFFISLILLFALFFSFYKYINIIKSTNGVFLFPTDDSYATFSYSIQMGRGYPFRFNDDEPPVPMEPSFLYQVIYSVFYKLGVRTPEGFSSFAFWLNMIFLSFTLLFLFQIFNMLLENPKSSFIAVSLLFLYNPFRYIFILGMGHVLLTFFFYLSLLFFLKRKVIPFFISGIFLALSRPESFVILLIFGLYLLFKKEKKLLIYNLILIGVWFLPSFIYLILAKTLLPTGIYPQSLLAFYPLNAVFSSVFEYLRDYLIGVFLGIYPSAWKQGQMEFLSINLPFGFFLISLAGIFNRKFFSSKSKEFLIISFINFLIFWIISGFSIYAGIHLLRHTAWLFPFIFFLFLSGIEFITHKFKEKIFSYIRYSLLGFYTVFLFAQGVDFENKNIFISILKTKPHYVAGRWIRNNIWDGEFLAITPCRLKFFSGKRVYSFSPGTNWLISKYSKSSHPASYFELLKYYIKEGKKYFLYWDNEDEKIPWFNFFLFLNDSVVYQYSLLTGNYVKVGKAEPGKILDAEKFYFPGEYEVLDFIDIKDPISERKHGYFNRLFEHSLKVRFFPIIGQVKDKQFLEGVNLSKVEGFSFYINEPLEKDSVFLIGRFARRCYYTLNFYNQPVTNFIELPFQEINIYINERYLTTLNLKNIDNFTEFKLYLPSFMLKPGKNEILVRGNHISASYWIVKKK